MYFCMCASAISSNNQFFGVLDALEWWECRSSDIQPSQNERIKWLPQRNCYTFKSLWEYLPSLTDFPSTCCLPTLKEFPFDLCYQFAVQCSAKSWNGLVLQDAHSGNSINSCEDTNRRCTVTRQLWRPDNTNLIKVILLVVRKVDLWLLDKLLNNIDA